jgi:hypothetical protein
MKRSPLQSRSIARNVGIPESLFPTIDNAIITCPACGAELGTRAQFEVTLREGAGNLAADLLKETLSKAFGDNPNVKLKL